jgi:hypothetical protein
MTDGHAPELATLVAKLREFVAERDWSQFHDPKNLAMAIASEAGELLAELRWISNASSDDAVRDGDRAARIEAEVGDIVISLLLFCDRTGIDPIGAADRKLAINAANYPVAQSVGRSERPKPANTTEFSRVIAVDWSGKREGGHDTIWIAEVRDGRLSRLENGRSRDQVTEHLIAIAKEDPNIVIGLDFAFSFPSWFMEERGAGDIAAVWRIVEDEGETWLRDCPSPFWGRPGVGKPSLPSHFRDTEEKIDRRAGGPPKSVFQINGGGAVGTGSIRGMPHLLRMREAGLSIWPFDSAIRPFVVEIYPRLLTGAVVKSDAAARSAYLAEHFPDLSGELTQLAANSEDAFDAAVSALVMWRNHRDLASLDFVQPNGATRLEGEIWTPRDDVANTSSSSHR